MFKACKRLIAAGYTSRPTNGRGRPAGACDGCQVSGIERQIRLGRWVTLWLVDLSFSWRLLNRKLVAVSRWRGRRYFDVQAEEVGV